MPGTATAVAAWTAGDGQITDPGAAIMDTAWPLLAQAWSSSVLGPKLSAQLASFVPVYEFPAKNH